VFSLFAIQSNTLSVLIIIVIAPIAIVMIPRVVVVYGGSIILRIASVRIPLQWQSILTLKGFDSEEEFM
jgi:hypothetical protein